MEVDHAFKQTTLVDRVPKQNVTDIRIRALKSLAILLLREVDSLESSEFSRESENNGELKLMEVVQQYEVDLIRSALIENHGIQVSAAKALGIKPTTLHAKIKRFGIGPYELIANLPPED